MIKPSLQKDVHRLIILDLAIKAILLDYEKIEKMRLYSLVQPIFNELLKDIKKDYYPLKNKLQREGIRIIKWQVIDVFFSDITLTTAGDDLVLRYAKKVLQHDVEQLVSTYLK